MAKTMETTMLVKGGRIIPTGADYYNFPIYLGIPQGSTVNPKKLVRKFNHAMNDMIKKASKSPGSIIVAGGN